MADARSELDVARLVAEHHQAVYGYAYRLAGSVHDAEDLTQQVYLIAHQKIGQLRSIYMTRSWLFTVLRNCFLRDRQRQRPSLAVDVALCVDSIPEEAPGEEVDQSQLQDALNRLPDAFRLVVVMFYFEECSYREIAEQLEMPIGTVMSRLARAKEHLRAILVEPEPERFRKPRPSGATEPSMVSECE